MKCPPCTSISACAQCSKFTSAFFGRLLMEATDNPDNICSGLCPVRALTHCIAFGAASGDFLNVHRACRSPPSGLDAGQGDRIGGDADHVADRRTVIWRLDCTALDFISLAITLTHFPAAPSQRGYFLYRRDFRNSGFSAKILRT